MLFHKHILINAKIINPIKFEEDAITFLTDLVNKIGMKIIRGPFASYVDKEGNRGMTAIVMIETSHIAFHIWDETIPSVLQFDLYTCGSLEHNKIIDVIKERFQTIELDYVLFDREDGFVIEAKGSLGK
jgi:S-adenosylmethionine/arginine decarboxylase-like enzyme